LGSELGLDLVEVSPEANPPVARLMNYGKFKYEQSQKARESKKKQTRITVKELKLKPKISPNDFSIKLSKAKEFLEHGDKVKFTMWFRGREAEHPEYGQRILDKLVEELKDLGTVDLTTNNDGKSITMVLLPIPKRKRK
jgi:translation initiation factor IF-3